MDHNSNRKWRPSKRRRCGLDAMKWIQKKKSSKSKLLAEIAQMKREVSSVQKRVAPGAAPVVSDLLRDVVETAVARSEAVNPSNNWLPTFESISPCNPDHGEKSTKKFCHIKVRN